MEELQRQLTQLLESQRALQELVAQQQEQISTQNKIIQTLQMGQPQAAPSELLDGLTQLTRVVSGADTRNLVDNRGFGRPITFSNREEDFRVWSKKLANYVRGVYKEAKQILEIIRKWREKWIWTL